MSHRRETILREMGIGPLWKLRQPVEDGGAEEAIATVQDGESLVSPSPSAPVTVSAHHLPPVQGAVLSAQATAVAAMGWEELETTIKACTACRLCQERKQAVPGTGDRQADWLFVGEGPGAEEDQKGEPFVGQAGQLLDNMLAAIGLKRGEDVYIANSVKCRPPGNRTPEPEETATCWPYLQRQIDLIRPRLIVALGRPAAQTLLQQEVKIGQARGHLHRYRDIPVIVTYHPAYLLRNLTDKAKAWEDLVLARRTMKPLKEGD